MKTIKLKGQLVINKKTIAQLTDAQLESIQGGAASSSSSHSCQSNSCNSCVTCKTR